MNILVIEKSIIRGRLTCASETLIKHLEFWHAGYNRVDILARTDNDLAKKLGSKVNILKLPKIGFLSLIYSYLYLIFRSKNYDLVIEVWENRPFFCLLFNRRRSLIAIFTKKFSMVLPEKIISRIYARKEILVNSYSVKEKLIKAGFKSSFIKFIPDGISDHITANINKNMDKRKNKILIVCEKDYKNAISIISLVERRSLDWKFVVLIDKKIIGKLKTFYEESKVISKIKAVSLTKQAFNLNVSDSKFVILTKDIKKQSGYITQAFNCNTPVILEGVKNDIDDHKIQDLILKYDSRMDIADKIFILSKNEAEYKKLQEKIAKTSSSHTWEEIGYLSLKYIESL